MSKQILYLVVILVEMIYNAGGKEEYHAFRQISESQQADQAADGGE